LSVTAVEFNKPVEQGGSVQIKSMICGCRRLRGRLDVRTQGDKQSVTIRPQGDTEVSAVSIAFAQRIRLPGLRFSGWRPACRVPRPWPAAGEDAACPQTRENRKRSREPGVLCGSRRRKASLRPAWQAPVWKATLAQAFETRQKEIHFPSRTRAATHQFKEKQMVRRGLAIAKNLQMRQLHPRQGCHPMDVGSKSRVAGEKGS
jgi:hypothetical protein